VTAAADAPAVRRWPIVLIAAIGLAWIAVLAWLVVKSANPIVVNRVQLQHARVIVQGVWQPGSPQKPPKLTVERTWKMPLEVTEVSIREPEGVQPAGRVIVPLTRISPDLYEITQGELINLPERHPRPQNPKDMVFAQVRPLVYPATPDVVRQIDALLSERPLR